MNARIVTALMGLSLAGAASGSELIVVSGEAKGGQVLSLDFVADGSATALEARLDIGAGEAMKVDTSGCARSLPKSHLGSCVFNGKELVVIVYSMSNAPLPPGMVDLGTVSISGGQMAKKAMVSSLVVAAPDGQAVESKSSIN
jgi:hypothetical protein